ncbi:hypothetical protein JM93_02903 [Roseibium hamelinense]|uniref:PH (Pleckstrin Homology) domain-containing protein n=1 Tax=Roseibium hamelinense TaxID=150831 RepID=A0A562STL0_9HYPH|nr:hypothetical protein [Roseibium hamelinense]MTI42693.1 hypothetical protein [Roseibium hamelinense]TWI84571.1 hypothetical protein JM93_02903 [Roseibium hamelinense]
MRPRPTDPFDKEEEAKGPVPFAIGFEKSNGEAMVYGSLVLGVIFLGASFAAGIPLLALAAIVPLGISFWHYPMIEKKQPQLGANNEGLFVERIGFIDWGAIRSLDLKTTSVRNIELTSLNILLNRSLEASIAKKQGFPFWKRIMMKNWKRHQREHGRDMISIQLHTLTKKPEDILDSITAFEASRPQAGQ